MVPAADMARRLALWSVVCGVSAAPSFVWAASDRFNRAAMLTGIGCFVLLLTLATSTDQFERLLRP